MFGAIYNMSLPNSHSNPSEMLGEETAANSRALTERKRNKKDDYL